MSSLRRRHQGHHLGARVGSAWGIAQVEALLDEFTQTQVLGEGHRKDQPGIGYQAVVVEGDLDAVGMVKWQHLLGAPGLGWGLCFQNHHPGSTGALSYPFSTPRHLSFRWIGAYVDFLQSSIFSPSIWPESSSSATVVQFFGGAALQTPGVLAVAGLSIGYGNGVLSTQLHQYRTIGHLWRTRLATAAPRDAIANNSARWIEDS